MCSSDLGDVTPSIPGGTIVTQLNSLAAPLTFKFGSTDATVTYKGLAPNFVGLYQFNVTVPNVADGDSQINITLGGTPLAQPPFFLTVKK